LDLDWVFVELVLVSVLDFLSSFFSIFFIDAFVEIGFGIWNWLCDCFWIFDFGFDFVMVLVLMLVL
jgi:hypothetical protein